MLLCRRHHRLVHEGGYHIEGGTRGFVTFVAPSGRRLDTSPRFERIASKVTREERPRWLPCWEGTPFDAGYVMDMLRQ